MTPEQLDMFERLEAIKLRIAELKIAEAELTAQITASFAVGSTVDYEGATVAEIVQPMKFDADKAKEVLAVVPKLLAAVMVPSVKISARQAKKVLPPEVYAKCQIPAGKPKVKFVSSGEDDAE